MIQSNKERREKPRIAFHIPTVVIGVNEKAQIADFSLNGFFVRIGSTDELKGGQLIRLALRFPHEKQIIILKAMITRIENNGFGCQFIDLSPPVHDLLETNFNIFSATLPIE